MRLDRRSYLAALGIFAGCMAAFASASAEEVYPARPIRLIVTYPAGGIADGIARIVGAQLGAVVGQPVIVENRAGAAGRIGTRYVATAVPDGYTLLLASSAPNLISPLVTPDDAYQPMRDLAPITLVTRMPALVTVPAGSTARTLQDLVTLGRSGRPVQFGSSGAGSYGHLAGEIFNNDVGTRFLSVPYKGSSESLLALMAGSVDVGFYGVADVANLIGNGKLRALAVYDDHRSEVLPQVPTTAEAGIGGRLPLVWFGLMGPARLPPEIVGRLGEAMRQVLATPDVIKKFTNLHMIPVASTPKEFMAEMTEESAIYAQVVKSKNISADR